MPVFKHLLAVCCLLTFSVVTTAQTKPAKPVAPVAKFKPPKLKTSLGNHSDSIVTVSIDEAINLVTLPLIITDDKKAPYTVTSYQCLYKRKGVTEDEESGKVSPTTSVVAQMFRTTPISDIWKKTISEQLKSGEEIFFFDVVAKDAQGHLMFAPNIKLLVK